MSQGPAAGHRDRPGRQTQGQAHLTTSGSPAGQSGLAVTFARKGRDKFGGVTWSVDPAAWSFVRSIDYWLWGLENDLTIGPLRCQRVASALAPMAGRGNLPQ